MKNVLMYMLIFLLIGLLLLPPGLRMFGKNLYSDKKVNNKKDDVYVLNCTGLSETVNLSYMNDKPYNFQYLVKGNYINLEEDTELIPTVIINDINDYAEKSYNEIDDVTEYRIAFNTMDQIPELLKNYSMKYEEQNNYYTQQGFNCTKVSY